MRKFLWIMFNTVVMLISVLSIWFILTGIQFCYQLGIAEGWRFIFYPGVILYCCSRVLQLTYFPMLNETIERCRRLLEKDSEAK